MSKLCCCSSFFPSSWLCVLSLNCNRMQDLSKRTGLLQWLRSLLVGVDVVCLPETHCVSSADCSLWFASSGFLFCVFLWSSSPVDSSSDTAGRFFQCEFSFCGQSFHVCILYAPNHNPDCYQFLEDVPDRIDPSVPTLVVGNFNSVFDQSKDRLGSDPLDSSCESSARLVALFDACCIVNIWRYLHPDSSGFTWTRWDGSFASHINLCGSLCLGIFCVLLCCCPLSFLQPLCTIVVHVCS